MNIVSNFDLRGKSVAAAGNALIARFNAVPAGTVFAASLGAYPPELQIWLLEAGMRHTVEPLADGAVRIVIERGASPAQGAVPGLHHLVAAGGSIWTCERASRVARIDAATGVVAAVRSAATKASHLAIDPMGKRLFIADTGANVVIAVRADDLSEIARWEAPGGPHLPLVSPDGVVCVTGGAADTLTVSRPRAGGYAQQTIAVGRCPHDPLLLADGAHVFVPCAGAAEIVKVRLDDGAVVGRCSTGAGPSHLARHPDGRRVYSANSWDGTLTCVTADGENLGSAKSGGWAHAIDITPDGHWVYVANFLDSTLAVFAADTLERVALLPSEPYPHGLDVSPDGRYVAATGFGSAFMRLYDAQFHVQVARIEVGQGSSHTAFVPSDFAWVSCSVDDHLARVDLAARACTQRIRVGVKH